MDRIRIQFDLSLGDRDTLDALVASTGAMTRAEVLRRAIVIYAALADKQATIHMTTKDGETILVVI